MLTDLSIRPSWPTTGAKYSGGPSYGRVFLYATNFPIDRANLPGLGWHPRGSWAERPQSCRHEWQQNPWNSTFESWFQWLFIPGHDYWDSVCQGREFRRGHRDLRCRLDGSKHIPPQCLMHMANGL